MVCSVNQSDMYGRVPQRLGGRQATKASSDYHNPWSAVDMIALDSVFHSEKPYRSNVRFLVSLLLNPNCRGSGNVVSSLRDSFRYELSSAITFRDADFKFSNAYSASD